MVKVREVSSEREGGREGGTKTTRGRRAGVDRERDGGRQGCGKD